MFSSSVMDSSLLLLIDSFQNSSLNRITRGRSRGWQKRGAEADVHAAGVAASPLLVSSPLPSPIPQATVMNRQCCGTFFKSPKQIRIPNSFHSQRHIPFPLYPSPACHCCFPHCPKGKGSFKGAPARPSQVEWGLGSENGWTGMGSPTLSVPLGAGTRRGSQPSHPSIPLLLLFPAEPNHHTVGEWEARGHVFLHRVENFLPALGT